MNNEKKRTCLDCKDQCICGYVIPNNEPGVSIQCGECGTILMVLGVGVKPQANNIECPGCGDLVVLSEEAEENPGLLKGGK